PPAPDGSLTTPSALPRSSGTGCRLRLPPPFLRLILLTLSRSRVAREGSCRLISPVPLFSQESSWPARIRFPGTDGGELGGTAPLLRVPFLLPPCRVRRMPAGHPDASALATRRLALDRLDLLRPGHRPGCCRSGSGGRARPMALGR